MSIQSIGKILKETTASPASLAITCLPVVGSIMFVYQANAAANKIENFSSQVRSLRFKTITANLDTAIAAIGQARGQDVAQRVQDIEQNADQLKLQGDNLKKELIQEQGKQVLFCAAAATSGFLTTLTAVALLATGIFSLFTGILWIGIGVATAIGLGYVTHLLLKSLDGLNNPPAPIAVGR